MLKHLIDKRKALLAKVEAVLNTAATEARSLTAAEETQRAADMAAIKTLDGEITAAQAVVEARSTQDALETRAASAAAPRALAGETRSGLSARETKDVEAFSFTRAFNKLLNGEKLDGVEAEMHAEGEREIRSSGANRGSGNFVVPAVVLHRATVRGTETRDITATGGSSGSEGGVNVQTNVQPIIERLRANIGLSRLGMTMLGNLQGNLSIPTFTADDQAIIKTEIAASAESSPTFTAASMSPRRVPVFVEVSRQMLLQSQNSGLENLLRGDLSYQIAKYLETLAINGSGSGQPYGILNTVGVGSVAGGTNGLAPTWDHIVDLESAIANVDAQQGNLGYYTNTKVRGKLKRTPIASNTAATMIWDKMSPATPLNENRCEVSTLVPSNLTKGTSSGVCSAIIYGNYADAVMGQWGGLEFQVNPFSRDTEGIIRINCWTFFDFLVRRPASFAVMKDALTV